MQISSYNRHQMKELIDSDFYKKSERIPISYHRAVSHIHNPDCTDDDILLWTADEDEKLVGYVGVLPGVAHVHDKDEKVFWLSCFWVDEQCRNGNAASLLFFPLIKQYGSRLLISNFIPSLEPMYQRLGIFQPTLYKHGTGFYVKSHFSKMIPARVSKTRYFKPLFVVLDVCVNALFSIRKSFVKKPVPKLELKEDRVFNDEFQELLDSFRRGTDFMKRDSAHFEWILNYPWVLQEQPDNDSKRYYFSSKAAQFYHKSLKMYRENRLVGYALLKVRDGFLTVDYLYAHDKDIEDLAACILGLVEKENLKKITTFDERLSAEIKKQKGRYLFLREIERPYIITKGIPLTSSAFQEGDGDAVFT